MGVHSPGVLWALASPAASFFLICPHCHLTADLGYTGQTVFTEVVLTRLLQAGPPCSFAKNIAAAAMLVRGCFCSNQCPMVATAVSVRAAELMMQEEGIVGGWLRWPGAQQGLRQDGRPGPTAASPHANAGHANNSGVAANPISIVYNK